MGKSKKPFINKQTSQKFHLLHRSHTDGAYALDGTPSDYVLVPADQAAAVATHERREVSGPRPRERGKRNVQFSSEDDRSALSGGGSTIFTSGTMGSHVTSLGFKNDGYDYEQHLKVGGGGHFIASDGSVSLAPKQDIIELPPEVLPSNMEELERDLGAITIGDEFMDEDLRDALFNLDDKEDEYEELDDNFVTQVLEDPKEADFDYDAHIANLIMKSERQIGGGSIRGWDYDEEGNEDDLEEFSLGSGFIGLDDHHLNSQENRTVASGVSRASTYAEEKFDKLMEEYDDDELGDAPYASETEMQGIIDQTSVEGELEKVFDEALDDFIKVSSESAYT